MIKAAKKSVALIATVAAMAAVSVPTHAQEPLVKNGEKIAFLGDSITQGGQGSPLGYVRLAISGLAANGVKTEMIGAGISGHKSNDMLGRLQRDVIDKKPNWMTLSCGVNDVWHGANGVPLDKYKENITAIVDKATALRMAVRSGGMRLRAASPFSFRYCRTA